MKVKIENWHTFKVGWAFPHYNLSHLEYDFEHSTFSFGEILVNHTKFASEKFFFGGGVCGRQLDHATLFVNINLRKMVEHFEKK